MEVLFLRHAHAVDGFGLQDEHRWLSERGRHEAQGFGRSLARRGWLPSHVRTSPKVRAVQTCELVLREIGFASEAEAWPDLAYGTTAKALGGLEIFSDDACVLLVGHEPLIRTMASQSAEAQLPAFSTATGALVLLSADSKPTYEIVG